MKIVLWIIAVFVVLAMLVVGGAVWWWRTNSADLIEGAKAVVAEGQKAGQATDENGCKTRAFARHKVEANRTFTESVKTGIGFSACLKASKISPAFCDGVPAADDHIKHALWVQPACKKMGFEDTYCQSLMQQVATHCSSEERAGKVKGVGGGEEKR